MRLSIEDINDPVKGPLALTSEVFLDGVKVVGAVMADEEEGIIDRYIPQDDPRWKTEFAGINYWPTERLTGKVEIRTVPNG